MRQHIAEMRMPVQRGDQAEGEVVDGRHVESAGADRRRDA
jgi:hypothetical protein